MNYAKTYQLILFLGPRGIQLCKEETMFIGSTQAMHGEIFDKQL